MGPAWYRDIGAERRTQAAECVARHLDELRAILGAKDVGYRVDEGSAVAAEAFLADTNTVHTAVRVAIVVAPAAQRALARALGGEGFERTTPTGDFTLLRLAGRSGRRAIHVLLEGDGARGESDDDARHPRSPLARRGRDARLRRAWLPIDAVYRRTRHGHGGDHDVTESFEVHVLAPLGHDAHGADDGA